MTSEKEAAVFATPNLLEFDSGSYNGTTNSQGIPHGQGRFDFKENDPMDRRYYEGQWVEGQISGKGKMVFLSQDIYEGGFSDGMPHGHGEFAYANGNVESAEWENGNRHGLSRYVSNLKVKMVWCLLNKLAKITLKSEKKRQNVKVCFRCRCRLQITLQFVEFLANLFDFF